jgi:hypothetical protein
MNHKGKVHLWIPARFPSPYSTEVVGDKGLSVRAYSRKHNYSTVEGSGAAGERKSQLQAGYIPYSRIGKVDLM